MPQCGPLTLGRPVALSGMFAENGTTSAVDNRAEDCGLPRPTMLYQYLAFAFLPFLWIGDMETERARRRQRGVSGGGGQRRPGP